MRFAKRPGTSSGDRIGGRRPRQPGRRQDPVADRRSARETRAPRLSERQRQIGRHDALSARRRTPGHHASGRAARRCRRRRRVLRALLGTAASTRRIRAADDPRFRRHRLATRRPSRFGRPIESPASLRRAVWQTPEGIAVKQLLRRSATSTGCLSRHASRGAALPARPLPDHVCPAALDDPPICRLLHGRGLERLLPAQSRGRPEGPVGRLRPCHPSRLRQRPSARRRRCRHGRRGDRFHPRHAPAFRRHPARRDDGVDDHERRGAADHGALHRRRRGTGRAPKRTSPGPSRTTS